MNIRTRGLQLFTMTLISSCTVGPDYVRPKVLVPAQFKEQTQQKKDWKPIHPQDAQDRGAWWHVFHDSVLNQLENDLGRYNQSIAQSEANYRQSLTLIEQARSGLFPTLAGIGSVFRQKQSGGTTTFVNTNGGSTSTSVATSNTEFARAPTNNVYSSVLYGSWEPDIWGLVRRTIESDVALAQSNEALVAVTRLSTQSALAQYYFELRTLDLNQQLLNNTVVSYSKLLRMVRHQYASGIATRTDIVQAQSQLETAQAQALNNGILRGQYEHAIAVLIGRPPADLSLKIKSSPLQTPNIPETVPSTMLERRPDIAQAERLVQSASARIGVAIAAFYPNLSISGSASANGRGFHRFIHTPALGWSTGMQLAQTFFDAGLRTALVHSAQAAYEAQVAAYRQTVLLAFQDVEDNLLALNLLQKQSVLEQQAADHAQLALKLMRNQYHAGTVDFSKVLTAQVAAYEAQKTSNDVKGLRLSAAVGLIKALGGGWV